MDDPFSNKISLLPMNQKKTVAAMKKNLSEANSKNILISNRFLSVSEEELKNLRDSRQSDRQNTTQNGVLKSYKVITCTCKLLL